MSTIQQQAAESDQEQEEAGQVAESNQEHKTGGSEQLAESDKKQEAGCSDRFCSNYLETLFPLNKFNGIGSIYPYSTGSMKALFVTDPNMVKDLAKDEPSYLGKPRYLGMGIFTSNGDLWKHELDKVIVPELKPKKAEGMVYLMVGSANEMLASWENITDKQGGSAEVVVDESLRNFAADVISKACFGSSYSELNEIFNNIRQLQIALAEQTMIFGVPGSRYLPTNNNIEIWSLEASIRRLILDMANKRREHNAATPEDEKHLLLVDSILKGAEQAGSLISSSTTPEYDFIVDNCKNIFFAGHETTATTAAWCLMLLASHPEWQSRARAEVQEVCRGKPPDVDKLKKLSTVTSVIQETLRLYPPTPFVTREALADLKLGDRDIPRGTNIWVPIALAHRNSAVWVGSPDRFDPGRFVGGKIAAACKQPHMNIPFGMGHRTCPGQSLAMFELRVVLALLLHKFEFALSRKYVHAPAFRISVEPGEGVPLILKKLDN